MRKSAMEYRHKQHHCRSGLRLTPLAAACASLFATGIVHAQQAAPVDKVVVTGIRGSIESSI
ncbi:MAG: hypothetical protein WCV99_17735, partial [Sterolibacterium sp.]